MSFFEADTFLSLMPETLNSDGAYLMSSVYVLNFKLLLFKLFKYNISYLEYFTQLKYFKA